MLTTIKQDKTPANPDACHWLASARKKLNRLRNSGNSGHGRKRGDRRGKRFGGDKGYVRAKNT